MIIFMSLQRKRFFWVKAFIFFDHKSMDAKENFHKKHRLGFL